jgi:hypothetical protein
MTATNPKVRILDYTPLDPHGSVRALLRVKVGNLTFNKCRLIVSASNAPPVVSPPMIRWRDPDGKHRYEILCEWPRTVREAVTAAALEVYRQRINTGEEEQI